MTIQSRRPYTRLDRRFRLDCIFPEFETTTAAAAEDRLRIRQLQQLVDRNTAADSCPVSHVSALALAEHLRLAAESKRLTLASSTSMRALRITRIGAMFELFDDYADSDLIAFTVINIRWVLSPSQLMATSAAAIRNQFRRHIVRAGRVRGPFIAFLHGEYEPIAGVFVLHFHGITLKANKPLLNSVSGRWGYKPTSSHATPVECDSVRDRTKQFSYTLKAYWPERAVHVVEGKTQRDRKPRRIGEPYHSLMLLWLDQQLLPDMQLLINCRVGAGGTLVAGDCT